MSEIDYENAVFYHADGIHQVRRYYTVEYLYDTQSEDLNWKYREKLYQTLENMDIHIANGCFWGRDFLRDIGVYIANKEVVPYTIYFPADINIDVVEKEIFELGRKYKIVIKPITAYIDIGLLMDKDIHGELSLNGKGQKLIPLTEDIIKPEDISDTASFMMDVLLGLEASGKNIVITDNYLFPKHADFQYKRDLSEILISLHAKRIKCYGMQQSFNQVLFDDIKNNLSSIGTELLHFDIEDFHDRFWINADTMDGLVFGTSLNGIGRKLCYYDAISKDDAKIVLEYIGI